MRGRETELAKKSIRTPTPLTLPWTTITAGNRWFLLPWKYALERDLPGCWRTKCFHNTGDFPKPRETLQPQTHVPGVESQVGRNAHLYVKYKTTNMDSSGETCFLPQPEVLPGGMCKCLWRVGLPTLIRSEPAERQGPPHSVLHPTGGVQAGNHVQEEVAAAWLRPRIPTVKASIH